LTLRLPTFEIATHTKTCLTMVPLPPDQRSASRIIATICSSVKRALLSVRRQRSLDTNCDRAIRPNPAARYRDTHLQSVSGQTPTVFGFPHSPPAVQFALDRAASDGHSCARSSGSPLKSKVSATLASSVRTGWTTY